MRPATLEELARDPVGRFVSGPTFAHFCAAPALWGVLLWGRPSLDDAQKLGRSLRLELRPPAEPHAALVDASRLESADESTFTALDWYMTHYAERLARWVQRLGLVRPRGLRGAVVSGIFEVVQRPYPVRVFDELGPALAWLAPDGDATRAAATASVRAIEEATQGAPVVTALRALLEDRLRDVSVARAARALGMSERTLQRKLAAGGTTFQAEVGDARVRIAQRRMLAGDEPLTAIALDVGCASLQHFNALFKSRTGESPSAWRSRGGR